eukprot:TRINITY_DN12262_c0_g1_i5.p2 TRINITY_DN12262_c0_g1~~TRINITY_DN12262_c0_g1_i5.p2  ORF type:complete len:133 (-),score=4.24 TRINITY_DN12262_c0_g1_i5:93-491(-)
MFDVTLRISYMNVQKWYKDVTRVCEGVPIALVGNKVDAKRKVKAKQVTFHRKKGIPYFEISARANFCIEKPIVWLLRKLLKVDSSSKFYLSGIQCYTLGPREVELDTDLIQKLNREIDEFATNCPEDSDDLC